MNMQDALKYNKITNAYRFINKTKTYKLCRWISTKLYNQWTHILIQWDTKSNMLISDTILTALKFQSLVSHSDNDINRICLHKHYFDYNYYISTGITQEPLKMNTCQIILITMLYYWITVMSRAKVMATFFQIIFSNIYPPSNCIKKRVIN